ncbi:MAG: hypothetical protein JWM34_4045 [Ilumatobacteraceae bacterium]|nr:hypothetical protein [Ilumatobacteraceae bacterium]
MAVIVVCSVHGSPGVTTLALDLARLCGPGALLLEADPDGGRLAARLDLGVRPGLTELAGAARVGIAADDLSRFAQPVGELGVIVAHPAAEQVSVALRAAAHHIATAASGAGTNVVVDIGRLRAGSPALALAADADVTLVVADNTIETVVAVNHRAPLLARVASPCIVLTSSKPYSMGDVADSCGQTVWGVVERTGARAGSRATRRRVRSLAQLVAQWAAVAPVDPNLESDAVAADEILPIADLAMPGPTEQQPEDRAAVDA